VNNARKRPEGRLLQPKSVVIGRYRGTGHKCGERNAPTLTDMPVQYCRRNAVGRPFEQIKNTLTMGEASSWGELKGILLNDQFDLVVVNLDSKDSSKLLN